jgi:hypothetical protein
MCPQNGEKNFIERLVHLIIIHLQYSIPWFLELLEQNSSTGGFVHETPRPWGTSSMGHCVQGRNVQGRIVPVPSF